MIDQERMVELALKALSEQEKITDQLCLTLSFAMVALRPETPPEIRAAMVGVIEGVLAEMKE